MTNQKNILLLGGTLMARDLLELLLNQNKNLPIHCYYSMKQAAPTWLMDLARAHPATLTIVTGGFSPFTPTAATEKSVAGLQQFCHDHDIKIIINATSWFADIISQNAHAVANYIKLPLIRLLPTSWLDNRPLAKAIENEHILLADKFDLFGIYHRHFSQQKNTILLGLGQKDGGAFLNGIYNNPPTQKQKIFWRMIYPLDHQNKIITNLPDVIDLEIILSKPLPSVTEEEKFIHQHGINLVIGKHTGGKSPSRHKIDAAINNNIKVLLLEPLLITTTFNGGESYLNYATYHETTDPSEATAFLTQFIITGSFISPT